MCVLMAFVTFFMFSCGSVIVDLVLRFNQSVSESDVISTLKTAAQQDQFGNFKVDPSSIKATDTGSTQGMARRLFPTAFFFFFFLVFVFVIVKHGIGIILSILS